ncbi:hypothetical protein DAEQUDRAFT_659131, partial [Daedalea quercina L-15889]
MHAIDLVMLLAYMAMLAHLLISPPTHSVDRTAVASPGLREAALMIYSIARLYKRPAFSEIPHILVLGAFTSHLPEVIYPDDVAFGVLLFAFSWMVIDLHLPWSTSPLHLIPAELILPRSVLISHGVSRIFIPVVAFFLPALLLSLFLLSTSLADIIPAVVLASLTPAPLESRVAFLTLFAVLFLTMICSLTMLVTVYPSFVSQNPTDPWDRCSRPIGLEARRFFIRTVVRYSVPYTFPAPSNLLQLVIRLPEMLLSLIRDRGSSPAISALRLPERIVWRMTVAQANAPTATALSTRIIPQSIPFLTTLCIRVFAKSFRKLSEDYLVWENVRSWLKALPDPLAQKVFSALKSTCPEFLSMTLTLLLLSLQYFIRAPTVTLDRSLPGVNRHTFVAIRDSPIRSQLEELHLTDFEKEADTVFASIISNLSGLRVLVLRGCSKAGEKTCGVVAQKCPNLRVLNMNYTSVTPVLLAPILLACRNLEVLKVAGISSWTDAAFAKLTAMLSARKDFQLQKLRTLKLRQTFLSDNALSPFMRLCPSLRRVDLSFTVITHPSQLLSGKPLEKLSLTCTKITGVELLATVAQFPDLVTLNIGALGGGGQGSNPMLSNTSALSMSDQTLGALADILETFPRLEQVNLVGNTKLGMGAQQAIGDFIRRVGRKCKVLNLSNLRSLRSPDLEGLLQESVEEGPPRIQVLLLNNTIVDDMAAPYISACNDLENLAVGGTRFTSVGLFNIIDACQKLQKLDLTSCRGVKISERRRFFEVSIMALVAPGAAEHVHPMWTRTTIDIDSPELTIFYRVLNAVYNPDALEGAPPPPRPQILVPPQIPGTTRSMDMIDWERKRRPPGADEDDSSDEENVRRTSRRIKAAQWRSSHRCPLGTSLYPLRRLGLGSFDAHEGPTLTVLSSWSLRTQDQLEGFYRELALLKSSDYLLPLHGTVVPALINVTRSPLNACLNMAAPHPVFWMEASADMPFVLKNRIMVAYSNLHARGILHGSPQLRNMLICGDGTVKLVDFQAGRSMRPLTAASIQEANGADLKLELRQDHWVDDIDRTPRRFIVPGHTEEDLRVALQNFERIVIEAHEEADELWKAYLEGPGPSGTQSPPRDNEVESEEMDRIIREANAEAVAATEYPFPSIVVGKTCRGRAVGVGDYGYDLLPAASSSSSPPKAPIVRDYGAVVKPSEPLPSNPYPKSTSSKAASKTCGDLPRASSAASRPPKDVKVVDFALIPHNGPQGYYVSHPPTESRMGIERARYVRETNRETAHNMGFGPLYPSDDKYCLPPSFKRPHSDRPSYSSISLGNLKRKREVIIGREDYEEFPSVPKRKKTEHEWDDLEFVVSDEHVDVRAGCQLLLPTEVARRNATGKAPAKRRRPGQSILKPARPRRFRKLPAAREFWTGEREPCLSPKLGPAQLPVGRNEPRAILGSFV